MKNVVRLKNVPSNIIEEAVLVLKSNTKINKFEYSNKFANKSKSLDDKLIVKEAEFIINDYLNQYKNINKKTIKKLKLYKALFFIVVILFIISIFT